MRRALGVIVAIVLLSGAALAVARPAGHHAAAAPPKPLATTVLPTTTLPPTTTTTEPASTVPPTTAARSFALAGCPPPIKPPGPPPPPPWHPAQLVPDSALPPEQPPAPWSSNLSPIAGKGMWVWEFDKTEGGNVSTIVRRAAQAGLRQLWVRVADSRYGFYGAAELDALVGPAHASGLTVIAWGFPYLYDPMGDASWSAQILAWRGRGGDRVDGFSPDIEKSTEGVDLTERRAAVYLGSVRRAAGNRLVVATVYRPIDKNWTPGAYPYTTMARYVDAFAPMVYWGCTDPREAVTQTLQRLRTLRPVHLIGQGYNMVLDGGRDAIPSPAETQRFLTAGRAGGALGASFWVWQEMDPTQWATLATFPWST